MKKILQVICVFLSVAGTSVCIADKGMDEFFADPKNKQAFDKAVRSGYLDKGRKDMVKGCKKEKAKRKNSATKVDCDCVAEQMNKVSDKKFFYESVVSLQIYQQTIKAMQEKDEKKVQQLKDSQAKRTSLAKILNTNCGL